jgi:hypothetical protein
VTAEFRRLGKRGSYRLGQLRAQGIATVERPVPFQPQFIRPYHRWPALVWLLGLLAGSLLIVGGAAAGWWFAPFLVGVLAGLANWIGAWCLRVALPAVAVMAAAGWGAPLAWAEVRGQHDGAAARVIAAAIGLPASAAITIAVTALVAVAQVLAGYWLGRALTPRSADDLDGTPARSARHVSPKDSTQPAVLNPSGSWMARSSYADGRRCRVTSPTGHPAEQGRAPVKPRAASTLATSAATRQGVRVTSNQPYRSVAMPSAAAALSRRTSHHFVSAACVASPSSSIAVRYAPYSASRYSLCWPLRNLACRCAPVSPCGRSTLSWYRRSSTEWKPAASGVSISVS